MIKTYSAPFNVTLSVTNKCNLSCKHCLAGKTLGKDDPSLDEIKRIIRELAEAKVFNISIFGGEPFMRQDIFEIIEYLAGYPFFITINTNGTLITKETAEKIAGYKRVKNLTISLDGDSADIMDRIRGKGSFIKAVEGIKNAVSIRKSICMSVTLSKLNYKSIRGMAALGKELGVYTVRFNSVFLGGNSCLHIDELRLEPWEHWEALESIKSAKKEFGDFITGSFVHEVEILEGLEKKDPDSKKDIVISPCGAAMQKCTITPEGWVTPCELLWDLKAGNIKEQGFRDIWKDSQVMKDFRKPVTYTIKDTECVRCRYKRLCYQGHRCSPYYYPDGLSARDWGCLVK